MNIIRFIIALCFTLIIVSCSPDTIVLTDSDIDNDIIYQKGGMRPFTGESIVLASDGKSIKERMMVENGKLNGKFISYYNDETIRISGYYKDGKYDGKWISWYEDETMKFEVHYQDDKLYGTYKTWYENGQLEESGTYKNNRRVDLWQKWDKSGELISSKKY